MSGWVWAGMVASWPAVGTPPAALTTAHTISSPPSPAATQNAMTQGGLLLRIYRSGKPDPVIMGYIRTVGWMWFAIIMSIISVFLFLSAKRR
jgi:hypothetical protein